MATTKKRINITLDRHTDKMVGALALRDNKPKSAKIVELLLEAIEIEEDKIWADLADERMRTHKGKWLTHEEVWKKFS